MSKSTTFKPVPGPREYPLIGSLMTARKDMLGFLLQTALKYGGITYFRLGPLRIFLLTQPEYIRQVLLDNKNIYIKSPFYQKIKYLVGNGLLTSEGNFWRRQRKLAQPAFHHEHLAKLAHTMVSVSETFASKWEHSLKQNDTIDVADEMTHLTLNIVLQTLFGTSLQEDLSEIKKAMQIFLEDGVYRTLSLLPIPLSIPTPHNRKLLRAKKLLDGIVYRIIRERRKEKSERMDLLAMFLKARDEETGEGMSDEQLHNEIMTIFLAGHETTATALSWTWYLLDQNPSAREKLQEELQTVLNGRSPTLADFPKLVYTRMVLEEAMRLYPPIWAISRTATQEDVIDGHRIPKGSMVMLGIYPMHHHPLYWENPESFDPERFRGESLHKEKKYIYFPFGGGGRMCIGNNFAMMEAVFVLAIFAQKFRLGLAPNHPITPEALLTLKAKHGIKMKISKQKE